LSSEIEGRDASALSDTRIGQRGLFAGQAHPYDGLIEKESNDDMQYRPYSAKYLVLLHTQEHPRALLFNGEHDFLAELDDDGFVVDNLVKAGTPCPPPPSLPLDEIVQPAGRDAEGQFECYALG
jgi:hypothetical protein